MLMQFDSTVHVGDVLVIIVGLATMAKIGINTLVRNINQIKHELATHMQADEFAFRQLSDSHGRLEEHAREIRSEQIRVAAELSAQRDALLSLQVKRATA